MTIQQPISLAKNQAFVGRSLPVLVEGQGEVEGGGVVSIGRSYRDAPEIDGLVLIEGEIPVGELVPVNITGAMAYDLVGSVQVDTPKLIGLEELSPPKIL